MKANFKCPRCKRQIAVGKHLHAGYQCPKCGAEFIVSREERDQGHVNYKHNFLKYR